MVSFHDSPETYSDDHMLAQVDSEVFHAACNHLLYLCLIHKIVIY